jgi:hypothetical protein
VSRQEPIGTHLLIPYKVPQSMEYHVMKMGMVLLPFPLTKWTLTSSNLQLVMVQNGSSLINQRSTKKVKIQVAGLKALQCKRKDIRLNGTTVLTVKKTPGSLSQTMVMPAHRVTFFMEKARTLTILQRSCQFTTALTFILEWLLMITT